MSRYEVHQKLLQEGTPVSAFRKASKPIALSASSTGKGRKQIDEAIANCPERYIYDAIMAEVLPMIEATQ